MTEDKAQKEIEENINHVIKTKIQPGVDQHGGIVKLDNFNIETGVATMLMSGACSGCAGSTQTLQYGIENTMKHYVKEVTTIEAQDDMNSGVDPYFTDWPMQDDMDMGMDYDTDKE